jgi:hypothetical protein
LRITSAEQLLARTISANTVDRFNVGVGSIRQTVRTVVFKRQAGRGFDVEKMLVADTSGISELRAGARGDAVLAALSPGFRSAISTILQGLDSVSGYEWIVARFRCFLQLGIHLHGQPTVGVDVVSSLSGSLNLEEALRGLLHVPGVRGNPERAHPVTAVGNSFPGTFEKYAASIIANWQAENDQEKLNLLGRNLEKLGLTWRVSAQYINDTQVELRLGRLPHGKGNGKEDMVNIADVGFGASQSLPVLVALLTAKPGQLVYLEQPELHLHPRAQSALAEVLADAARRGVKVVAETHSDLLILAVQSLVAEGKLPPELVKLHWFQRNAEGVTEIFSADLDENGAYGDWPEDFADVRLRSEDRYLDAVHLRNAGR